MDISTVLEFLSNNFLSIVVLAAVGVVVFKMKGNPLNIIVAFEDAMSMNAGVMLRRVAMATTFIEFFFLLDVEMNQNGGTLLTGAGRYGVPALLELSGTYLFGWMFLTSIGRAAEDGKFEWKEIPSIFLGAVISFLVGLLFTSIIFLLYADTVSPIPAGNLFELLFLAVKQMFNLSEISAGIAVTNSIYATPLANLVMVVMMLLKLIHHKLNGIPLVVIYADEIKAWHQLSGKKGDGSSSTSSSSAHDDEKEEEEEEKENLPSKDENETFVENEDADELTDKFEEEMGK